MSVMDNEGHDPQGFLNTPNYRKPPTCKLCNDTGEQRYWEGRWRDEKAENERLRAQAERDADSISRLIKYGAARLGTIEQIARMRVLHDDDNANRVALHCAIEVAKADAEAALDAPASFQQKPAPEKSDGRS